MMQENDKRGGKWITAGDVFALKELCNVVADMHEQERLSWFPIYGRLTKRGWFGFRRKLSKQARAWLKEFGLTPAGGRGSLSPRGTNTTN
jgi:hypothetical protein